MGQAVLKDGIYETLRDRIVTCEIHPKEALTEERFSKEFNVSRTPTREAIRQLVNDGFAEYAPHCGARVVMPTARLIQEVLVIREALEGIAAREAATRIDAGELISLRQRFDNLRAAVVGGDLSDVGDVIHGILFQACGNRELEKSYLVYRAKVEWFQRIASGLPHRRSRAFFEHDGILRALEARDPVWAESAARGHIRATLSELLQLMEQSAGRNGDE